MKKILMFLTPFLLLGSKAFSEKSPFDKYALKKFHKIADIVEQQVLECFSLKIFNKILQGKTY